MSLEAYLRVVNDYLSLIKVVGHEDIFVDDIGDIINTLEESGDELAFQIARLINISFNN